MFFYIFQGLEFVLCVSRLHLHPAIRLRSSIDKICSAYVINELQITPTALTGGGGRFMEQSRVHPPWPDRRTRPN